MNAFRVTVPATTANLGPGFDCLGLALSLHLRLECRASSGFRLELAGEGAGELPRDATNLLVKALMRAAGLEKPPSAALRVSNEVPLARGLGSSSAAAVAGLAAGFLLAGRKPDEVDRNEILRIATELDGHPDNVAPALLGGMVVSGREGDRVLALAEPWPRELAVVAVIPELRLRTDEARRVLPARVAFEDAAANLGRVARLLGALRARRFDLLSEAVQDRLHQPYRLPLAPGLARVLEHLRAQPASLGAYLSGSGPTLAAFCREGADELGRSAVRLFEELGVRARHELLSADPDGLRFD